MHPNRPSPLLAAGLALALSGSAAASTFADMDGNNDGHVSSSEYEAYASRSFDRIDGNHDGQVTVEEIHAYVGINPGHAAGPSQLSAATRIQRRDTNGDGVISRTEYTMAAGSRFQELDRDHNNQLTRQELAAGY
jgi:Ca2+-binding EF-hand superfamily protein